MKKVVIALDWTPNTNHSGFFCAERMGYYRDVGLDVRILPPSATYEKDETPARMVVNGNADFCIAPTESLISCWTSDAGRRKPFAVAAVLQEDNSAIVVPCLEHEGYRYGIQRPQELDGRIYASYGGRFEMNIVQGIIREDGGKGTAIEVVPPKLRCFSEIVEGNAAATWIFMGWEGLEARRAGFEFNVFRLADYIPYGYSPILLADPKYSEDTVTLKAFLAATRNGYHYALVNPEVAVDTLLLHGPLGLTGHNENLDREFLLESQEAVGKTYLNERGEWGIMDYTKNERFIDWLFKNECITDREGHLVSKDAIDVAKMFTNDYLMTTSESPLFKWGRSKL